jgi:hypothetical protein
MAEVSAADLVWVDERPTSIFEEYHPPAPQYNKGIEEMAVVDLELYRLTHGPIPTFTTFLTALED